MNYRTTKENLNYAVQILEGVANTEWIDSSGEVDTLTGYHSLRSGPKPLIRPAATLSQEIDIVAAQIKQWWQEKPHAYIGVLVRSNSRVSQVSTGLEGHGIASQNHLSSNNSADSDRVTVITMHQAKGLEFTHVILMGVSHDLVPQWYRFDGLSEADKKERLLQERALLYVAASRARDAMMITMSGEPSTLLP
ncbi:3'-5' exonuclease [Corynebacterium caspium]|uniref:3'-5' exonuclease n=1 Tax=Corynebacterium caspium TaxID=234828 RepID=UPI0024808135|nr:3'-5' exonuclease [Corynebacterium caspium]